MNRKRQCWISLALIVLLAAGAWAAPPVTATYTIPLSPADGPNGHLRVTVLTGQGEVPVGSLPYGRFYRTGSLLLPDGLTSLDGLVLRVVPDGGGASHVD